MINFGERAAIVSNILFVGSSKFGKTSLINALFGHYFVEGIHTKKNERIEDIMVLEHELNITPEYGVRLFESSRFGKGIDQESRTISRFKTYLKKAHEEYNTLPHTLLTEQELNEKDKRIHCLFYLLPPCEARDFDFEFIKQISHLVPIITVIVKVDDMHPLQLQQQLDELLYKFEEIKLVTGEYPIFDFQEKFPDDMKLNTDKNEEFKIEEDDDTSLVSELSYGDQIRNANEIPGIPQQHTATMTKFPRVPNIFALYCRQLVPEDKSLMEREDFSDFPRLKRLILNDGTIMKMFTKTKLISIEIAKSKREFKFSPLKSFNFNDLFISTCQRVKGVLTWRGIVLSLVCFLLFSIFIGSSVGKKH